MYKAFVFLCCVITLILVSTAEAKGGRGGGGRSSGRSSGRGSGKSSRGGGFFSSGSSGKSSSSFGGGTSGNRFSGGLFHGFFHSTPHHYTYRPTHIIHSSSSNTGSYHTSTGVEEEQNKETDNYAVGYSISKALNNDFFSIFNVVHDISKYPDKIRNKELLTTTTQSPVSTYDLNYIVNPYYTSPSTPNKVNTKSNFLEDDTSFGMMDKDVSIQSSIGNFENILEVTSTESTTSKDTIIGAMESKNDLNNNDDSIPSSFNNFEDIFKVTSTEKTTMEFNRSPYFQHFDNDAEILKLLDEISKSINRFPMIDIPPAAFTERPNTKGYSHLDVFNQRLT